MRIEQKQIDIELSELAHCYSIRNLEKNGCILIRFAREFCLKTLILILSFKPSLISSCSLSFGFILYIYQFVCACVCVCHFHSAMCCHTALTCIFYHYSCFTLDNNFELSCTFKHISTLQSFQFILFDLLTAKC